MFTLYSADYINSPGNCSYPHKIIVTDETTLAAAVSHDYVCAEYMNSYRNGDNFLGSDCLPVDCDNDHSENPADWVTPADVQAAFPGISFAVHYSRFHMREKNGKPARPKFHVLFPIEYMTDAAAYSEMKNSISRVMGLYSGNISADTLTFGCRRNVKPEMAEVKGKRLLIAAEMQEGARLNDSTVKQLCSTDDIFAEKKYKDPFSFSPSHSLVLYTNHLPRVSASDDGTWRRLIVIPFNAKIEGKSDIKNYGDYLYQNAAESILAWIIEGAKKVIDLDYKFPVPAIVQKAIDDYRSQNDWFGNFLAEKCDVGDGLKESSSALYQAYRNYCLDCNEYVRNTADFYLALENAGFERLVVSRKRYFKGLSLKSEDEDFLN